MTLHRALVTGATGFIGFNLCKNLLKEKWEVAAIVREESNTKDLDLLRNVNIYRGTSLSELHSTFQKARPDVVFHLASYFVAEHTPDEIDDLCESNICFGIRLLDASSNFNVKGFVNIGTSWQNYDSDNYNPVCLYAATKQAFQDILTYYSTSTTMRCTTLKLFDTYGPGDKRRKILNLFAEIADSENSLDMSLGEQRLDFVYIEDVVDAIEKAAYITLDKQQVLKEEYVVSSGNYIRLKDLAVLFEKVTHKKLRIQWGKREYRKREVMQPWKGGELVPGWEPKVPLELGIQNTYKNRNQSFQSDSHC